MTSGKSLQKAFMFNPYRKLAKLSLKRARLSCISCNCSKLEFRSVNESDNSAKAGSRESSGNIWLLNARSLVNEPREMWRRGVVGACRRVGGCD